MDGNGSEDDGFVHRETGHAASSAINKLDGVLPNEEKVSADHFNSTPERSDQFEDQAEKFTNIYVKNFGDALDDTKLREMFEAFGFISSCKVMVDDQNHSRGFGFVSFEDHEDAQEAVEGLNGKDVGGRALYVGRAQTRKERASEIEEKLEKLKQERNSRIPKESNLYVKNLDETIDVEALIGEFAPFGTIISAKVMSTKDGRSKGFGFVGFSSPEEATKAVAEMNGKIVFGKPMYVALAQSKDERRAQLGKQYARRSAGNQGRNPPIGRLPMTSMGGAQQTRKS